MITARLKLYFDLYSSSHQTRGNQITHVIGIPFILISVFGLLSDLMLETPFLTYSSYFRLDAGTALILISLPFYLYLDWQITLPYALALMGLYFLGRTLPTPICWTLFILGWILQGIGHAKYEKKSPAFFQNLIHLGIGPLWIFSKLVGYSKNVDGAST